MSCTDLLIFHVLDPFDSLSLWIDHEWPSTTKSQLTLSSYSLNTDGGLYYQFNILHLL